ncbi:cell wall hydrolase [Brevundimonas sp. R86498]|uniref:cell wall hydrolase n=1 Tax=Brevundimonas sp. R86498 TaxID=3093845 RepID=UPI0037CACA4F
MSAGETPLPVSALALRWAAAKRVLRQVAHRFAFSHWAPVGMSGLGIFAILAGSGGAVLQTRLAEIAAARNGAAGAVQTRSLIQAPPAVDFTLAPEAVRPISMEEARIWNAGLPFSPLPILAARPFIMAPDQLVSYSRALDCLTAAVYYEAASETGPGQAAVAQVVLNRMRHPAFPKTVCGVVFQGQERTTGCQFSFTCDGAMARIPSIEGWARARAVASSALNGFVAADVGMATHYHTDWVAPYWAERLVKMRQIGTHIFYRWTGGWGLPSAFTGGHAGEEPVILKMAAIATPVEELPPPVIEIGIEPLDLGPVTPIVIPTVVAPVTVAPAPEPVAPVTVAEAPPPPPAVMANPLAPPSAAEPRRGRRIAAPR